METQGTKKNTTNKAMTIHNVIILDASGSMFSIYEQALSGVNETITTIRKAKTEMPEQDQILSLGSFADNLQHVYNGTTIEQVGPFTRADYQLRGCTALYDAMGEMLTRERRFVRRGDKVLVTIITDGYENASKQWTAGSIKQLVDELRREDWVFTYIGANQDVEKEAQKMGVVNTLKFEATVEGTVKMFEKEARSRQRWNERVNRGEENLETGYFVEDEPIIHEDRVTPERIDQLAPGEVFVFGSNIQGKHNGGAAKAAMLRFGAEYGVGEGHRGKSYAIPTVGCPFVVTAQAVQRFIDYARHNRGIRFYVTPIGCGNGGWDPKEMASLFSPAKDVENITLPLLFWQYLV